MEVEFVAGMNIHLLYLTAASFLGSWMLVFLARRLPRLCGRADDTNAVQAMHVRRTPRVGGIAIFGALVCGVFFVDDAYQKTHGFFVLGTSILFFVGLSEDLGYLISARLRLLTVLGTSLIISVIMGAWLSRIGVPVFDHLLQHWLIGVPFTLLITAGVANGFNLIDGVNGLASMTAISAAVAIALIAQLGGQATIVNLAMMLAAVALGFFLVNYPFGLLFLGDAGAYTIGFVLSWLGVLLIVNASDVSPWAILLTVFWPLADTLLAVYRRWLTRKSAFLPDRLHAHQLTMRAIEICFVGRGRRHIANPLTTLMLAPFVLVPQFLAVLFWNNNLAAFLAVLTCLALFFITFILVLSSVGKSRIRLQI